MPLNVIKKACISQVVKFPIGIQTLGVCLGIGIVPKETAIEKIMSEIESPNNSLSLVVDSFVGDRHIITMMMIEEKVDIGADTILMIDKTIDLYVMAIRLIRE